jgi:hypothetical protein
MRKRNSAFVVVVVVVVAVWYSNQIKEDFEATCGLMIML